MNKIFYSTVGNEDDSCRTISLLEIYTYVYRKELYSICKSIDRMPSGLDKEFLNKLGPTPTHFERGMQVLK